MYNTLVMPPKASLNLFRRAKKRPKDSTGDVIFVAGAIGALGAGLLVAESQGIGLSSLQCDARCKATGRLHTAIHAALDKTATQQSASPLDMLLCATPREVALLKPLLTHLDDVDDALLTPRGWLGPWPLKQRRVLLHHAVEERSLPGVRLAVGSNACDGLDDASLQSMLTSVMSWCAPRSLRFRLQTFLIGRNSEPDFNGSHLLLLRQGDEAAQRRLLQKLLAEIPALKPRGASMLHKLLRAHAREAEDMGLLHEEISTAFQDGLALSLCGPFLTPLVSCGGVRNGLDASHVTRRDSNLEIDTRVGWRSRARVGSIRAPNRSTLG